MISRLAVKEGDHAVSDKHHYRKTGRKVKSARTCIASHIIELRKYRMPGVYDCAPAILQNQKNQQRSGSQDSVNDHGDNHILFGIFRIRYSIAGIH